ncbi:MAG: cyanophycin synthetase [Parcubacteria group bacterium Gr01-1014_24]|nr:MAG: cyanophycin synthetase [Parcubacteria group bacterium Gr01-1014_24]
MSCLFSIVMQQESESSVKKSSCSYCGDASINHTLSFLGSSVSITLDTHAIKIIKYVPSFVKDFVDLIPRFLFETLALFKLVKFSSAINRAHTFRSRVIWEEARKRGIIMEQVIFIGKPLDQYRATLNGKNIYFESIPIRPEFLDMSKNWDDKVILKREFSNKNIPVPAYFELSFWSFRNIKNVFSKLKKPIIVKPRIGSRGRHTVTNINTLQQFREGINIAGQICSYLIAEEHLKGSVCRATLVGGVLAGFYKGHAPTLIGDGQKTIRELIEEKDSQRHKRVEPIRISKELHDHILRSGFTIHDILPAGVCLSLSHRIGRLFGGTTKEMLDDLHPSFVPILKEAAKIVGLSVVGFDCIIPDPTKDASSQKWGIIECNSLPFIDLHYYALEGKPRNIAGMIWDMWQ